MADEIIGTAILDRSGLIHWLYFVQKFVDGYPNCAGNIGEDRIPVKPEKEPDPCEPPRYYSCFWKYNLLDGRFNGSPSIHVVGHFHNAGAWSVDVVESRYPGNHDRNFDDLRLLNREIRS